MKRDELLQKLRARQQHNNDELCGSAADYIEQLDHVPAKLSDSVRWRCNRGGCIYPSKCMSRELCIWEDGT